MASETALINRALVRIGAQRITSLSDDTPQGQAVRDIWTDVRQSFLRSHPWNFATFRDKLALSVTGSISPRNTFGKPGPSGSRGIWLRTLQISEDPEYKIDASYRDAGGFIRSDASQLYSRTIHDITDMDRFEPLAREALMFKLVCELCVTLANSLDQLEAYTQLYDRALAEARKVDTADEVPTRILILDRALALLGDQRLYTQDKDGPQANVIRDVYKQMRQSLLRAHAWNFAIREGPLLQSADAGEGVSPRYTYFKPLIIDPTEEDPVGRGVWLRTVEVSGDSEYREPAVYRDYGNKIYSDAPNLYMRAVHDFDDENLLDPMFQEALTLKIAMHLAAPLQKPVGWNQLMEQRYEKALAQARSVDSLDNPPPRIPLDTWELGRFENAGGRFRLDSVYDI